MQITLYKCTAENNRVDKSSYLSSAVNINVTLKQMTSVMNPTMTITDSAGSLDVTSYNYLYIPDWNRYYFINNITSVRNGLWEISASIDVLHTYRNGIRGLKGVILRQENDYNVYLPDNLLEYASKDIVNLKFSYPTGGMTPTYILLTAGGGN